MTTYRVSASPNGYGRKLGYPNAVILTFIDKCACGTRHVHGSISGNVGPDGTYGTRSPHCRALDAEQYTLIPGGAER